VSENGPQRPGSAGPPRPAAALAAPAVRGDGLWLALLVPGALAATALPLSAVGARQLPTEAILVTTRESLMRALYLHGGGAVGPAGFPLGWYWTGVLAVSLLATGAWYRRRDRAAGRPGVLRGYLAVGAALVALTAALPLLGWRTPALSLGDPAGAWLGALWQQGAFALLAIAVTLGMLARARRSRGLAIITVAYAVTAGLAAWAGAQPELASPFYPYGSPAVLLPAAVLLAAGAGYLLTAARRPLPSAGTRA